MSYKNMEFWNNSLNFNLGYIVNRTALRMFLSLQRSIRDKGYEVTVHQWGILQMLYENDGLSQVELADLTKKDKPNITRILDIMEKNRLITRRPDKNDRRKFLIYLTADGKRLKNRLSTIASDIQKKAFKGVKKAELEQLRSLMNRIYKNLETV